MPLNADAPAFFTAVPWIEDGALTCLAIRTLNGAFEHCDAKGNSLILM